MELSIETDTNIGSGYFKLVPAYFSTQKLEIGSWMSKTGNYSFSVSLYGYGTSVPFASATFNFEGLKQNTTIEYGDQRLLSNTSDPIKYPTDLEDASTEQAKWARAATPYLSAMSVLKRKHTPPQKPDPYDLLIVEKHLKDFCLEESKYNMTLPPKDRVNTPDCAVEKNKKKRRLDFVITEADMSNEILAWANIICPADCLKQWSTGKGDIKLPVGAFYSKAVLSETREANVYGQKFASILGAVSDDMKKILKDELPSARDLEDQENDKTQRALELEYFKAIAKWHATVNKYTSYKSDGSTDMWNAKVEMFDACGKAIEAAIAYGKKAPCPPYE
ncbi:hypothetical protein CFII64_24154 [Pseudomonas sp. CFII64]|nr:hypothetical protein CFII64_24154 [Pseudomonas sp. CFII64]